jgi:hypothetical protein
MRLASVLTVLLVLLVSPLAAQTTETFTVDGVSHTLIYPPGSTQVETVKAVLQEALPIYNTLFGMTSLQMQVTLQPVAAPARPDLLADASPNNAPDAPDCLVNVYPNPASVAEAALKFTLAHEFSHCYQFETRSNPETVFARTEGDPNAWWIEGSAEWLASKVYRPFGDPIVPNIADLFRISNVRIFDNDYEQYWFIRFFANQYGDSAVIDLIRNIPLTNDEHITYLNGIQNTRDMFALYGTKIAGNYFAEQPVLTSGEVENFPVRALPTTQALVTDALSVKVVYLTLPAGTGVGISLAADSDPSYKVMWRDGTPITADSGVQACGVSAGEGIFVIVARGNSTTDGAVATVKFEETPCEPTAIATPACMVGTWQLIRLPEVAPVDPETTQDLTGSALEIREDGGVTFTYRIQTLTKGPERGEIIEINMAMGYEGVMELGQRAPGIYVLIGGSGSILPEKSLKMTIEGNTQDLTAYIDSFLTMAGAPGSTTVYTCTPDTLIQTITVSGSDYAYVYVR